MTKRQISVNTSKNKWWECNNRVSSTYKSCTYSQIIVKCHTVVNQTHPATAVMSDQILFSKRWTAVVEHACNHSKIHTVLQERFPTASRDAFRNRAASHSWQRSSHQRSGFQPAGRGLRTEPVGVWHPTSAPKPSRRPRTKVEATPTFLSSVRASL